MRKWTYLIMGLSIPASVLLSFHLTGWGCFLAVAYAFAFVPLVELMLPAQRQNLAAEDLKMLSKDSSYDYFLWLMVPAQYVLLFSFLEQAQFRQGLELVGVTLSFGVACGALAINCAHELGHRRSKWEQFLAKAMLLTSLYMHFFVEHNKGHHRRVGTQEDPATSRINESVYRFWLRSIIFSLISAFKIDGKATSIYLAIQGSFLGLIAFGYGFSVMFNFMVSAIFGIVLLETVNYIEHYGLERKKQDDGRYEKVKVQHSWNSDHPLGRSLLFELSRHSDHHSMASKKYQCLQSHEESPQMPSGYPAMMLLSLLPPLWFRVMNPRVRAIQSS